MHWLFYGLLTYLAGCYLAGMYLVLRLMAGTRLRRAGHRLLRRQPGRPIPAPPDPDATPATGYAASTSTSRQAA